MTNVSKIAGFVLLGAGLIVIFFSLYTSYSIFTGQSMAPEIFSVKQQAPIAKGGTLGSLEDLQRQLPDLLQGQIQGLLPANGIPQMMNMISWSVFASILFFGGGQIAGLGIKLLK